MSAIALGESLQHIVLVLAPGSSIANAKWLWTLLTNVIPLLLLQVPTLAHLASVCIISTITTLGYAIIIVAGSVEQCTANCRSNMVHATPSPPPGAINPAATSISGRPATTPAGKAVMVCSALGILGGVFTCTELVVEWASNIKAAPQPTNQPRANGANTWAMACSAVATLVVGVTGYAGTGGACSNVIDCMQLPVPLLVRSAVNQTAQQDSHLVTGGSKYLRDV